MSMDLNIRVISNLKSTKLFTLYEQYINLNAKNFKINAWKKSYITPGAQFYTVLPLNVEIQGILKENASVYKTNVIRADYNKSYEIYMKDKDFGIQLSSLPAPINNTMNVYNVTTAELKAIILSNGKTFFSVSVNPNGKLNFCIIPLIYISICDYSIEQQYFKAASLSPLTMIDYRGQPYLTIVLSENYSTGKFFVNYNFDAFDVT